MDVTDKDSFILYCNKNKMALGLAEKVKNLERFKEEDGFIYLTVADMQSFGWSES